MQLTSIWLHQVCLLGRYLQQICNQLGSKKDANPVPNKCIPMSILKDKFTGVKNIPAHMTPLTFIDLTATDKKIFAEYFSEVTDPLPHKGQDDRKRCDSFKVSDD